MSFSLSPFAEVNYLGAVAPNDKSGFGNGLLHHTREIEDASRLDENVRISQDGCHWNFT